MLKKLLLSLLFSSLALSSFSLNAQTLREKIGQMVWTSFSGTILHDTIKVDLEKRNLGGIILFAGNISNPNQIKQLNETIKYYSKTPPFIAVDQEGGRIARLNKNNGFDNSYSAYTLGTIINQEDSTRKSASIMAEWLKQSGFNVNLAPVADVNVNPNSPAIGKLDRSYSQDPYLVFQHTKWFIEEFNKKKIITCLKHFPGHGSALQDSHLGFTDISNTWSTSELIPYQSLIASGYNNLIMTGHLYNSFLDLNFPASLSNNVTTQLLRSQLGFNGVTITDAMVMQAITNNYSFEDAIEFAVNAGNDILLYQVTLRDSKSLTNQVIDIIEQKVLSGKISSFRIEESYNRIMQLKLLNGIITSVDNLVAENVPSNFKLLQNYPNPFNSSTIIKYTIPPNVKGETVKVTLKVFDVLGREVATLVDEYKQAGNYSEEFRVKNEEYASGILFYQLIAGIYTKTIKMVLVK